MSSDLNTVIDDYFELPQPKYIYVSLDYKVSENMDECIYIRHQKTEERRIQERFFERSFQTYF